MVVVAVIADGLALLGAFALLRCLSLGFLGLGLLGLLFGFLGLLRLVLREVFMKLT